MCPEIVLQKDRKKLVHGKNPLINYQNSQEKTPEQHAENALSRVHVQNALLKLSKKERTIFTLRHFHDLKINDIAETLNISSGTVKSLLFRAVRKMQKNLTFYENNMECV